MINKDRLIKYQRKNRGNTKLINEIEQLLKDLENSSWKTPEELKNIRIDADCVHSDSFYFFNIANHRTMIFIMFNENRSPNAFGLEITKIMRKHLKILNQTLKNG